jgi:DNA-binding MurR/RpiR family transcriptional regulator
MLRLTPPESAEQRIRAVLADEPTISIRQLAKRANVSESTASKYARVVRLEVSHAVQ